MTVKGLHKIQRNCINHYYQTHSCYGCIHSKTVFQSNNRIVADGCKWLRYNPMLKYVGGPRNWTVRSMEIILQDLALRKWGLRK